MLPVDNILIQNWSNPLKLARLLQLMLIEGHKGALCLHAILLLRYEHFFFHDIGSVTMGRVAFYARVSLNVAKRTLLLSL